MSAALIGPLQAQVADREGATLDAVSVTAQRYEQRETDVPAGLGVVDRRALDTLAMPTLEGAADRLPGLVVDRAAGGIPRVFIRGIGDWMDQQNKRIAVLVDGVPQPEAYLQDPLLPANTARIEVLKGPQGTLYGRGAVGGTIQIISDRPRVAQSHLIVGAGLRSARDLDLSLNRSTAAGDRAISIDLRRLSHDGDLHDDASGRRVGDTTRERARVRLDGRVGGTDVLLSASGFDDRTTAMRVFYLDDALRPVRLTGFDASGAPLTRPLGERRIDNDIDARTRTRGSDLTLDLSGRSAGVAWRSITSVMNTRLHQVNDADASSLGFLQFHHDPYRARLRQVYQSFTARRPIGDLLLQAGLSASHQQSEYDYRFAMAGGTLPLGNHYRTDSLALYGDGEYLVSAGWSLLGGVRLQRDRYRMTDRYAADQPRTSADDDALAYRIGSQWTLAGGARPYLIHSTANTPGGVNTSPATDGPATVVGRYLPYRSERIRSLEAGVKGGGERLRYAVAVYHSRLDDMQQYNPANTQTENLGAASFRGAEIDLTAALTRDFELRFAYGLNRSRIERSTLANEVGRQVGGVSPQTARLAAGWHGALAGGRLEAGAGLRLQSGRYIDNANTRRLGGQTLLDAHVRWTAGPWSVSLAGTNLTDRAYYSQVFAASAFAPSLGQASWAAPRTVMARVGVTF